MKKIIAVAISLLLSLTIVGCGGKNDYVEPEKVLNQGSIMIYGKEITLPTPVKTFVDLGFRPQKEYGNVDGLSGVENDYKVLEHDNGSKIEIYVANYTNAPKSFESCYVVALKLEPNKLKTLEDGTRGVVLSDSLTLEIEFNQMVDKLGNASEIYSEGSVEYHTYYGSANTPSDLLDFANTYKNELTLGFKGTNLREVELLIDVFE